MVDFRLFLLHLLVQHQIAFRAINHSGMLQERLPLAEFLIEGDRVLKHLIPSSQPASAQTKEQNHKSLQQQWLIISTLLSRRQQGVPCSPEAAPGQEETRTTTRTRTTQVDPEQLQQCSQKIYYADYSATIHVSSFRSFIFITLRL